MRMTRVLIILFSGLLAVLLAAACNDEVETDSARVEESPAVASNQPYAGWESRPIRALAPELVDDLLAGRGAGYALAAELNHYPGPTHVLKMADQLSLTSEQESSVRGMFDVMQTEAQVLGRELVDLEAELEQHFSSASIDAELLRELTGAISIVDGKLRFVHLAAHLGVSALLSQEQIDRYDRLRGYSGDHENDAMDHDQHNAE